jgi:hypothetical protein
MAKAKAAKAAKPAKAAGKVDKKALAVKNAAVEKETKKKKVRGVARGQRPASAPSPAARAHLAPGFFLPAQAPAKPAESSDDSSEEESDDDVPAKVGKQVWTASGPFRGPDLARFPRAHALPPPRDRSRPTRAPQTTALR